MFAAYKQTKSPLVSAEWLQKSATELPSLVILDVSIPMPGEKRDCYAEFEEKHIPGARFLSLADCADKETDNAYMLPSAEKFSECMSKLGVLNSSKVVVYDANEKKGMFSSPRAWYMFRVFGHTDIWILDGGLLKWMNKGYRTEAGPAAAVEEPTQYKPVSNARLVKSLEQVQENISQKSWSLIDARSEARFHGKANEPRPGIKSGHIAGSECLFWIKFLDSEEKVYKPVEELKKVYEEAGIDLTQPHVATCGTGVTACFIVLTSYILGAPDVPVYDGAWFDWYQHAPDDLKEELQTE